MTMIEGIKKKVQTAGSVWLGGEMEFPFQSTVYEAYSLMNHIACDCGYLVGRNGSRITVSGGDIVGYFVLDWYDVSNPCPQKIEHWVCKEAYFEEDKS